MIYSSWDKERDRLKLVILGNFLSFYPPKTLQKYNFEKLRNTAGDIILLHLCTKNYNRIISGSLVRSETERIFLSFSTIFFLLPPNDPKKQIFEKKKKTAWRYYPFTYVYYKCRSYDIWFLKYKVQQIGIFLSFLAIFCPFRIFCHFGLLTDIIYTFHFGLFFAVLPLLITKKKKNIKKKKMETNRVDIIVLHMCAINVNHM